MGYDTKNVIYIIISIYSISQWSTIVLFHNNLKNFKVNHLLLINNFNNNFLCNNISNETINETFCTFHLDFLKQIYHSQF